MLLLYAIPIGIALGLLAGGSFDRLAGTRIRLAPLALVGLAFQLVLFSAPVAAMLGSAGQVGPMLYFASTLLVLLVLALNARQPGFRFIFAGATFNMIAIVANGGFMPASPDAWLALHGLASLPTDVLTNSILAGPHTPFAFLGDIFAMPRSLPLANVFSIGDVLIAAGGAWFVTRTMGSSDSRTAAHVPARPVPANA